LLRILSQEARFRYSVLRAVSTSQWNLLTALNSTHGAPFQRSSQSSQSSVPELRFRSIKRENPQPHACPDLHLPAQFPTGPPLCVSAGSRTTGPPTTPIAATKHPHAVIGPGNSQSNPRNLPTYFVAAVAFCHLGTMAFHYVSVRMSTESPNLDQISTPTQEPDHPNNDRLPSAACERDKVTFCAFACLHQAHKTLTTGLLH
jgi:hypothetical protein